MQKCDFHDFRVVNNMQLQIGCLKFYVSQLLLPLFIISDILQSVIDCICACFNVSKWTIFFCGMLNWDLPRFSGIGLQMALAFSVIMTFSYGIPVLHYRGMISGLYAEGAKLPPKSHSLPLCLCS